MRTVEDTLASILAVQPLHSSFKSLVAPKNPQSGMRHAVEHTMGSVKGDPCLVAAAYLYSDDLAAAHKKVYDMEENEEACYWHGIMHRREADFFNANYWFRRAGSLPARLGIDPIQITERCQDFYRSGAPVPSEDLLEQVRKEWRSLAQVGVDRLFNQVV
jgi:hypothetical protein